METVKKAWRRGFIDDSPKTLEEQFAVIDCFLEHIKEEEEKALKKECQKS